MVTKRELVAARFHFAIKLEVIFAPFLAFKPRYKISTNYLNAASNTAILF